MNVAATEAGPPFGHDVKCRTLALREIARRMRFTPMALSLAMSGVAPLHAAECVVLIHGLGRTSESMASLGRSLAGKGYVIVNKSYPSTAQSIEKSAAIVGQGIAQCRAESASPINFVTHSLGAIVLRQYFQTHGIADAGRVVMLAPPNHGSEIIDHLKDRWWFRRAMGPTAQQLGTGRDSLPNRLKPIPLEIGVIAGTHNYEPWFAGYFHGPNDGKVSVESTKLPEMRDFLTVDASHTFLMNSRYVQNQVLAFLMTGSFSHPPSR